MLLPDLTNILQWWAMIFLIGIIFTPITSLIFHNFFDKGYIFAKVIGIALISYAVFVLGFLKIAPFTEVTIIFVIAIFALSNIALLAKNYFKTSPFSHAELVSASQKIPKQVRNDNGRWKIFFFEEILFLGVLFFWSFIHAHQQEIHGLEKYMDYGFINSILRAKYFPPLDMWFTPFYINYYYFGHLITAVLTKLSLLSSQTTFNLMLSAIAALSFASAFSIGANLINLLYKKNKDLKIPIIAGLITAFILNFAGNLHTIYLFFKPYANENPIPFWQLVFSPITFPNGYWYPNATRFIENTIHEFPLYSYVVSDLHGHVLDIPFVLLTIAVLLSLFFKSTLEIVNWKLEIPLISFLLAVMYMTNAWDGIIYILLTIFVISYLIINSTNTTNVKYYKYFNIGLLVVLVFIGSILFSLSFNLNFKPFASGIGILCAPKFLTDIGNFGPFIFEPDHCQHSPLWQLGILYGFFYFWVISFILFLKLNAKRYTLNASDIFVGILIILSTLLIIIPEFIYVKDIYPAHYRANTMFKLVYQSFIMLALSCGYIIVRLFLNHKSLILNQKFRHWLLGYWAIGLLMSSLVFLYPYFSINSYFGNLKSYQGLDGIKYLKSLYPNDYEAILWINKNIKGQPIILEAQGDSYTDYGRVSANTGLPTVLGWTVHEWLWRGSYDIPSPRIPEVQKLYELDIYDKSEKYYIVQSGDFLIKIAEKIKFGDWRKLFDINKDIIENPSLIYPNQKLKLKKNRENQIINSKLKEFKDLINKYKISLVFIGALERQKYPKLNEEKFKTLGKIIYQNGNTKIYKLNI